jgi:radical SAM protein with 4Fe4S-binding SPASM domain
LSVPTIPPAPGERSDDDLAQRLVCRALADMGRVGSALPGALRAGWQETWSRWQRQIHPALPEQHFLVPTGTPAFQLLAWVAESVLDEPESPPTWLAGEAMLAWYFALRIQDDIVDEDAPPVLSFLEQVLSAHALRVMVEVAGRAEPMVRIWERVVRDFATTAVEDARQRADGGFLWTEEVLACQGRKYLPMAGPLAALLLNAGRDSEAEGVVAMVEELSTGLQLTNDLFGASKDLAGGERSPYLAALGLQPGLHGPDDLGPAVCRGVRSGAHQAFQERIESHLRAAPELLPLSSPRLERHVSERLDQLRTVCTGQRLEAVMNTRVLVADLEITRRCDLRCPHCFLRQQDGRGAQLDTDLILEILEELSGYATHLHLTGGEPFVHPDIRGILERSVALGIKDMAINTSGTQLDSAALDHLASLGARPQLLVSLDGPPGAHDRARGSGVTQRAIEAILGARERDIIAYPATVMTHELVSYGIERWHAWLAERLGTVEKLALWCLFMRPGRPVPEGSIGTPLSGRDLLDAAKNVVALLERGEPVVVGDFPVINVALADLGVPEDELWQCGAGSNRLCVQADGVISPFHPLRLELGTLAPGRVGGFVARAFASPLAARMARRDAEVCGGCSHRSVCGGCQAVVTGWGLPPFSRDPSCEVLLGGLPDFQG